MRRWRRPAIRNEPALLTLLAERLDRFRRRRPVALAPAALSAPCGSCSRLRWIRECSVLAKGHSAARMILFNGRRSFAGTRIVVRRLPGILPSADLLREYGPRELPDPDRDPAFFTLTVKDHPPMSISRHSAHHREP